MHRFFFFIGCPGRHEPTVRTSQSTIIRTIDITCLCPRRHFSLVETRGRRADLRRAYVSLFLSFLFLSLSTRVKCEPAARQLHAYARGRVCVHADLRWSGEFEDSPAEPSQAAAQVYSTLFCGRSSYVPRPIYMYVARVSKSQKAQYTYTGRRIHGKRLTLINEK